MRNGNGGYDEGYTSCCPFWDTAPGSIVREAARYWDFRGSHVVDLGCGEGKNAAFLSTLGASVDAVDLSEAALKNARLLWPGHSRIRWLKADVQMLTLPRSEYDVAVAYGVAHCLPTEQAIEQFAVKLARSVRKGGLVLFCSFNARRQEFETAHPNFHPTLISHQRYMELFSFLEVVSETDSDLIESHPHNNIEHVHSLTRIAGKVNG
jgi:tellurite methyltransferase